MQIKDGWLAICSSPRLAGQGRTPYEAQMSLDAVLRIFWAALETYDER